ncbi:MAG TPA: prephenate dehydrogenase/arogenate dehydrogenase family protein [Gemmatimonadaceae bacterium]|nr:prephenate dehydrogenase/arogenate dehydrogenase family protein [Gemmatimonadaceae bacterium]
MSAGPFAVIGLGCIGGSLARTLAARGVPARAWSASAADREQAAAAGVPVARSLDDAVRGAAVAVLAVPLSAVRDAAVAAHAAAPEALILHTAGLQGAGFVGVPAALHDRVLGTHPLAGAASSGFAASREGLFAGCAVSIESRAGAAAREAAESLWRLAGAARFDYREAAEHDLLITWVSHLPQLAATALAGTLASSGLSARDGGPGLLGATRLAASSFEMWAPLLAPGRVELECALDALGAEIARLRRALASRDESELANLWESARAWRLSAGDRP